MASGQVILAGFMPTTPIDPRHARKFRPQCLQDQGQAAYHAAMRMIPVLTVLLLAAGCAGQVRPPKTDVRGATPEQTAALLRDRLALSRRIFRVGDQNTVYIKDESGYLAKIFEFVHF